MISPRTLLCLAAFALAACTGRGPDISEQPLEPTLQPSAPAEGTAPVYVGLWAGEAGWCENAPGSGERASVSFTESEFLGYENRCLISQSAEGTEGGYRLVLSCLAEGVERQETVDIDVDGTMLRMRRDGADETVFVRCPPDSKRERQ